MANERLRRARAALRMIAKGLRELRTVSTAIPPFTQQKTLGMHDWAQKTMLMVVRYDDMLGGAADGPVEPMDDELLPASQPQKEGG
jgi:hypothetical protein